MRNKPIHVMHVLFNLAKGGMEGGVVNIANNIDQERFKVSICCLESAGQLAQKLKAEKKNVFILGKKPGKSVGLIFQLKKLFETQDVDIVHTHNYGTLLYSGIASLFCKNRHIVHGEHGDLYLQYKNFKYIGARKFFASKVSKFHAVSSAIRDLFIQTTGVSSEKIIHIPNGLDLEKFRPDADLSLRDKLGIGKEDFVVLGVGSFYRWKNFNLIIEAVKSLKNKGIDVRLILAGDGPLKTDLKQKVLEEGLKEHVCFAGYRKDIPELMNISDLLVQPSLNEGMSNTIMEAMACAKPVIASDVGGNPELVCHGETGYLFSLDNPSGLVNMIFELKKDRKKSNKMGLNARKKAEEKYDLACMIKEYERLYVDL